MPSPLSFVWRLLDAESPIRRGDAATKETLNLVKEIIQREAAAKGVGGLFENFTLELVITTAHDKELYAYSCSANLVMYKPTEEKVSMPFTFDVRPLATDPTQFVVQVFGL